MTAVLWCWTCDEPSVFLCQELCHDVRGRHEPGDPAVEMWHESMAQSTSARLRETQAALAASQADLTRVENERDELRKDLAVALEQWQLDIAALINAKNEIEQQAIRIDELENQLRQEGGDARA